MHPSAFEVGKTFFDVYWLPGFTKILDIGSYDVNGTLRRYAPPGANYLGIDLAKGPGVDLVLDDPYVYPFPDGHFDCVISTSCLEHDKMFWLTFSECCRVVSADGFVYVNAPASGPYHGYPYDHWRFYPDAALALEEWSKRMAHPVSLVESFNVPGSQSSFRDCVMVFSKRRNFVPKEYLADKYDHAINVRKGSNGAMKVDSQFL